jgi:two-component system NtrC family response regulator
MVAEGQFREDLWFRINTFEIGLPPLRDRAGDVPLLARHLAARFRHNLAPDDEIFTPEALDTLSDHCWPGNVRELANVIEHALILCEDGPIETEHLPRRFASRCLRANTVKIPPGQSLRQLEMQAIHDALDRHGGNKPKAAEELGISLKTLYNKLNHPSTLGKSA